MVASAETPPRADRPGRPRLAVWVTLVVSLGVLLTTYRVFGDLADGHDSPVFERLIQEMTAVFGGGLLYWPLARLVRRRPLDVERSFGGHAASAGVYLAALLTFAFLHTSWNWLSRSVVYAVVGLGRYDYGEMPLRYVMELGVQTISFAVLVVGLHAGRRLRHARERELRAIRLESALARAQVHNLRLQLQPHFLFNALNTISATLYRDPDAAD
ncbi:MAG: histidine kinase, partial [Acidobacteriota bacterium]